MTKKKRLTFYSDAGHGWLKVKLTDLFMLGIADKISPYSYMRDEWAYLEEDCDAQLYIKTYLTLRGLDETHMKDVFSVKEFNAKEKTSRIRNYYSYQLQKGAMVLP